MKLALLLLLLGSGCGRRASHEIVPSTLPEATVGKPYSVKFALGDTINPYVRFLIAAGEVPPGINGEQAQSEQQRLENFSSNCREENGETLCNASMPEWVAGLEGTPTKPGTYTFTVQANSTVGSGTRTYTLVVRP